MCDVFQATCDECGKEFPSDLEVWDDYEELADEQRKILLILNTGGYHELWLCGKECQMKMTEDARQVVVEKYGAVCKCGAKIGEVNMRPCEECKVLVCDGCSHGKFCSQECLSAKKNCLKCNQRIPHDFPNLCEYCARSLASRSYCDMDLT